MLFHIDINLHDVECQLVLDILGDEVPILSMAITDAEIPEILDFGEVFDHKEVVLIGLGDTIGCLTRTCQICKLSNLIFDFTMSLLRRRGLLWNLRFVRRVGNVSHGCAALLPMLLII